MEQELTLVLLNRIEGCLAESIEDLISMKSNLADAAPALERAAAALRDLSKRQLLSFDPEECDAMTRIAADASSAQTLLDSAAAFHSGSWCVSAFGQEEYLASGSPGVPVVLSPVLSAQG
jgi:hypothetical protein